MSENRHIRRSFARERPRAVAVRQRPFLYCPMALLALLALFIQGFVVQTHIHIRQNTGLAQSVSVATFAKSLMSGAIVRTGDNSASAERDKYPINEDPSNCPLCQEIAHSGPFVQSAAVLATVPASLSVHFILFSEALPSFFAVSHNWLGRAPPLRSTGS